AGEVEDVARDPGGVELLRRERRCHAAVGGERTVAVANDGDDDAARAVTDWPDELDTSRGELPSHELACRGVAALRNAARVRAELGRPSGDVSGLAAGSGPVGGAHVVARSKRLRQQHDHVEQYVTERRDSQGTIVPWTRTEDGGERGTFSSAASWAPRR